MSDHLQPNPTDMSSEAIDRRLKDLAQLFKLGTSIQNIKVLGNAEDWLTSHRPDSPDQPQPSIPGQKAAEL